MTKIAQNKAKTIKKMLDKPKISTQNMFKKCSKSCKNDKNCTNKGKKH